MESEGTAPLAHPAEGLRDRPPRARNGLGGSPRRRGLLPSERRSGTGTSEPAMEQRPQAEAVTESDGPAGRIDIRV